MSEIRDAINTIMDIKSEFAEVGVYSTKRSISASAMEGTANFPVLVEDSISLDDAMVISRGLEKKYASFLLTVLTMDPYLEVEKGHTPTASEYLKQFHQNIRVKDSEKGFHMNLLTFASEAYDVTNKDYTIMECEAFKAAHAIYEGVKRSIPQDRNVLLNYTIEEVTTPDSLNSRFGVRIPVSENNGNGKPKIHRHKHNNEHHDHTGDKHWHRGETHTHDHKDTIDAEHIYFGTTNRATGDNVTVSGNLIRVDGNSSKLGDIGLVDKYREKRQWKPLTDNECKKANDLVPTVLHIRIFPIDKYTREELSPIDFMMGVKATLHPIPVAELARMVVTGMRNENMLFNFIRWTTGEIKFFKDFVFALDTLKADAKDAGRDVTGWRPALKRRKNRSKIKLHLTKNSIMPNATLVVSEGAIKYILETYGYDLEDERIIQRMMEVYFLLGFVHVNTVNQRATFRFDGIESADTYTFDSLKRENQNDDKTFKNLMKMLGRSM